MGVPACLAPFFLLVSLGSLPLALRVLAGALCLISVAAAVDAWGAAVVVGSEGVLVRRTFVRHRLPWAHVARFAAKPSGLHLVGRLAVKAVLRDGRRRAVSDQALVAAEGRQLLEQLTEALEAHRR